MIQGETGNNNTEVKEAAEFLGMQLNQIKKSEDEFEVVKFEAFGDDEDDNFRHIISKKGFKKEGNVDSINVENKILKKIQRGRSMKRKQTSEKRNDSVLKEECMQLNVVEWKLDVKLAEEVDINDENSEDGNYPEFSNGLLVTNKVLYPRKKDRKKVDRSRKGKMQSHEFSCNQCFMRYKTPLLRDRHMLRKHEVPMSCEKCDEKFVKLEMFYEHMKNNHPSFICNICGEQKFTKASLDTHIESQHQGNVPCSFCDKSYTTKASLNLHIGRCHGGNETLSCTKCDYKTNVKHELKGHYTRRHTELNKQTCESCGKVFSYLKGHLERTPCGGQGYLERKKVPCIKCDKKFSSNIKMRYHIKIIHGNVKDKRCSLCSYATYSKYNLKLHVSKMHLNTGLEKIYVPSVKRGLQV